MTDIEITQTAPATPATQTPEPAPSADNGIPDDSPVVTVYSVFGMNCGHCSNAVTRELSAIHGVTGVTVDLGAKKVTVGSTRPLSEDEVRAAVDEAGYELG
ncbi:heavy-metal-associated domain-containing protein [Actinospica durhamensis]|uniref:Heavy-metal-associated domain-containing protein n=1 Tax=Actinospica durhamensis TaxID=1508375 RepID=A0A941EXJ1_9ACTN|nr:heavy-metal-associated domain-containing protein [Actinospica durhamensis]MBR7839695.1 heavy-metal-associated domain-containing protein [Actinospica durhamensis]